MKTTENKKIISLVERLSEVIEIRNQAIKEESNIKAELKTIMSEFGVNVLGAGSFVMIISNRTRIDVNKELVQSLLGEKYNECLKKSEYQIFEVKKA